jgi:ankyrin repeat protein
MAIRRLRMHYLKKRKIIKLLIENGADVNVEGRNGLPIVYAVTYVKNFDPIEMLYHAGANINVSDENGLELAKPAGLSKDKKKIEKLFASPPAGKGS